MNQYPSFIYTKTQPYIFPIVGLRFFCTIEDLRNPTNIQHTASYYITRLHTFPDLKNTANKYNIARLHKFPNENSTAGLYNIARLHTFRDERTKPHDTTSPDCTHFLT